jgi:hypothetical protein
MISVPKSFIEILVKPQGQAPIRPPASATAVACSVAISRGCPSSPWPSWPCEMITGWLDSSSTVMVVAKLACAQSTTMPSRLHSATTSRPNRLRPPRTGASVCTSPSSLTR